MAYSFDETFAASIPDGYGTTSSGVTQSYNAAQQAADLAFNSQNNGAYWRITAVPEDVDFWFEMDVEFISRSYTNGWHFGFFLWSPTEGGMTGHRLVTIGNPNAWTFSNYTNGGEFGGAAGPAATWAADGTRHTLRVDAKRMDLGPGASNPIWRLVGTVDGNPAFDVNRPYNPSLQPALWGYGITVRLHGVKGATGTALPDMTFAGVRELPNAAQRLRGHEPAVRPISRAYQRQAATHHSVFSGAGRITGSTKEKGLPSNVPVSRRVLLLDDRTHQVVAQQWSDPATGAYTFDQLSMIRRYTVISYDHEGDYRAVIADAIVPTQAPDLTP